MNTERSGGRSRQGRRRRGGMRNSPRGGRPYPQRKEKKVNPVVAFFTKILGLGGSKPKLNGTRPASSAPRGERPARPQSDEKPEVLTPRLYIGNLSYDTSESDLFDHFSKIGEVKNAEVVRDGQSKSKGFGFVEMASLDNAKLASEKYHRTDFMGRQIVVAGAKK